MKSHRILVAIPMIPQISPAVAILSPVKSPFDILISDLAFAPKIIPRIARTKPPNRPRMPQTRAAIAIPGMRGIGLLSSILPPFHDFNV
jgi:hypothetical protein